MEWDETLIELRCAISDLIQDKGDIGRILNDAGIESKKIDFNKTPENIWHDTLYKVKDNPEQVQEIIERIEDEPGENPTF